MDFKERFGLDYLSRGRGLSSQATSAGNSSLPPGMEDALFAYGGRILGTLREAPGSSMKLLDLAKNLGLRIDTLLPVVNYMSDRNMVVRTEEDPLGNDTYQLSAAGERLSL